MMKESRLQTVAELVDQCCLLRVQRIAGTKVHWLFFVSGVARNLEDHRLDLSILKLQARGSRHRRRDCRALACPNGLVLMGCLRELIPVRLEYDSQSLALRRAKHRTDSGKQRLQKKQLHAD